MNQVAEETLPRIDYSESDIPAARKPAVDPTALRHTTLRGGEWWQILRTPM